MHQDMIDRSIQVETLLDNTICTFENISAYEVLGRLKDMCGLAALKNAIARLELEEHAERSAERPKYPCWCLMPTRDPYDGSCGVCHGEIYR